MTKKTVCVVALFAVLALVSAPSAEALNITPTSPSLIGVTDYTSTIDTPEEWWAAFKIAPEPVLSYKSEVVTGTTTGVGNDTGPFASSYQTVFSNTLADPSDALIQYLGGSVMGCSACYLLVKDGNNSPAQYLFSLAGWDGIETISLSGFWPKQGAISNVAIYNAVPEPATLGLLAAGMTMAALRRRRARS